MPTHDGSFNGQEYVVVRGVNILLLSPRETFKRSIEGLPLKLSFHYNSSVKGKKQKATFTYIQLPLVTTEMKVWP